MIVRNKIIHNLYEKYKTTFDYIQLIALTLAAIALLVKYMHWAPTGQVLIICFCTLAFLFAFKGNALAGKSIGDLVLNMGLSVLSMGVLFRIQHWQGATQMIYAGGAGAIVGFVLKTIFPAKATDQSS